MIVGAHICVKCLNDLGVWDKLDGVEGYIRNGEELVCALCEKKIDADRWKEAFDPEKVIKYFKEVL